MSYDSTVPMSSYIDTMKGIFIQLDAMERAFVESFQVAMILASFGNFDESPYETVLAALKKQPIRSSQVGYCFSATSTGV